MRLTLALTINAVLLALAFLFVSHLYIAVLVTVSLLAWFFHFLWRRQNLVLKRVESKVAGQNVILPVEHIKFWALESSGYSQTSGMGYMALTEDFLYFELALLDLVITVPTSRLRGAEFVRRLKGVSPVRRMLRIMYINDRGEDDSMAVNVKEMDRWKKAILGVSVSA